MGQVVEVGPHDRLLGADHLSDVVFVEMPEVGDSFEKGEAFGVVYMTEPGPTLVVLPFSVVASGAAKSRSLWLKE